MIVKNLSAQELVHHGDLGQRLKLQVFHEEKAAAGLMHFTNGWVHLPTWFPITDDGITCENLFAYYKDEKYEDVYVPIEELCAGTYSSELEGVCAIGGDNNYWHFMMERLPQLFFLNDPDLANRQIAHSFTKTNLEFCCHILERLGFQNRTFVEIPMDKPYGGYSNGPQFMPIKDVVIPTKIHRNLAAMLWDKFLWPLAERPSSKGRRLFVVREDAVESYRKVLKTAGRRQCLNQDEIGEKLKSEGFESVNPSVLSIQEQMRLFAESEFVIGVHGAALTNFLFAPQGSRVVELANGIEQPHIGNLSKERGLDFTLVLGMPDGDAGHHADFTVDINEICQLIRDK